MTTRERISDASTIPMFEVRVESRGICIAVENAKGVGFFRLVRVAAEHRSSAASVFAESAGVDAGERSSALRPRQLTRARPKRGGGLEIDREILR